MNSNFRISANSTDMGVYQGATAEEAIKAYIADAGYSSIEAAADACSQTVEEFLSDITTEEVGN